MKKVLKKRKHMEQRAGREGLLVVHGPAQVRHRAARGLRARVRAPYHAHHGGGQHPRRDPVPPGARPGGLLETFFPTNIGGILEINVEF